MNCFSCFRSRKVPKAASSQPAQLPEPPTSQKGADTDDVSQETPLEKHDESLVPNSQTECSGSDTETQRALSIIEAEAQKPLPNPPTPTFSNALPPRISMNFDRQSRLIPLHVLKNLSGEDFLGDFLKDTSFRESLDASMLSSGKIAHSKTFESAHYLEFYEDNPELQLELSRIRSMTRQASLRYKNSDENAVVDSKSNIMSPVGNSGGLQNETSFHGQKNSVSTANSINSMSNVTADTADTNMSTSSPKLTQSEAEKKPLDLLVCSVSHSYKPILDDEIEVRRGDLVRICQEFDDGWCMVTLVKRRPDEPDNARSLSSSVGFQQGVCPRACLSFGTEERD